MESKNIFLIISIILGAILLQINKNNLNIEQKLSYVNEFIDQDVIFLKDSKNYIAKTKINVESINLDDKVKELVEILIIGGRGEMKIPSGFKSIISSDTVVNDVEISDKTCKLDFNEYLLNQDEKKLLNL